MPAETKALLKQSSSRDCFQMTLSSGISLCMEQNWASPLAAPSPEGLGPARQTATRCRRAVRLLRGALRDLQTGRQPAEGKSTLSSDLSTRTSIPAVLVSSRGEISILSFCIKVDMPAFCPSRWNLQPLQTRTEHEETPTGLLRPPPASSLHCRIQIT